MSWASVVPKELAIQPLPLIVLTGLDTKNNAVHKEIWDGFNVRSNQKFRYKLLDGDYEYPKCKAKRPTEFYIPKGVMKSQWLNKHLFLIPGLVVVFFDLDWDEPNWKEKQMECATKMELVRHSLVDRNTRIILILIQKHPSIPIDGDNSLARERYPALCAACSIKNNYLFLLHAEFLHGYIMKLEEEAFAEPVQTYYTLEIKAIKFKRDSLIKVTHQLLFARLAIKIAFFNEMKDDVFKAIEYYKQAYMSLLDIRIYATNILEVKVVAGLVNYKLCKLFFDIKHPIDAIDQFRKHIDIFRIKEGPVELRFEHSAWLCTQFRLMGELFESAIERGLLNAVQTQHPGFYFHSAATHAIQRRQYAAAARLHNKSEEVVNNFDPVVLLEGINSLEFYGQRPWRQGLQGMEILDQQKEREGILALIDLESKENLTPFITDLFKLAIKHFKVFNCKRMKQYLSVCMAEEFYHARNYQEALNIYVKVLNDYNNEHWWPIITSIMFNALKCAYLIADATNYCLLATEMIGKNTVMSSQEKARIQENLLIVLQNERPPVAEYHQINTEQHSIEEATRRWEAEIKNSSRSDKKQDDDDSSLIIPVHVSGMVPFVECKTRFVAGMFNLSQPCELDVYLRTNCPDEIQFDRLSVKFNLSHYNSECVIVDNRSMLTFQPGKVNKIRFCFTLNKQDVGKDLEITSISLEIGGRSSSSSINKKSRVLMLIWKGDCRNALWNEELTKATFSAAKSLTTNSRSLHEQPPVWNHIRVLSGTSIVARKANIEMRVEHKTPVLVDETYAIRLTIKNNEESLIKNVNLTVDLQPLNDLDKQTDKSCNKLWIKTVKDKSIGAQQQQQTCSLSNLEAGQEINEMVYVSMNEAKIVNMSLKIKYDCDVLVKKDNETANETTVDLLGFNKSKEEARVTTTCSCFLEETIKLESVNPFRIEFSLMSLQMKPAQSVRLNEPFLLLCDVRNQTPYSIKFLNSYLNLKDNVHFKSIKSNDDDQKSPIQVQSFLRGETLRPNETATECFCLVVKNDKKELNFSVGNEIKLAALGDYLLDWRRTNFSLLIDRKNKDNEEEEEEEEESEESRALVSATFNLPSDSFNVKSKFLLPEIGVEFFPLLVRAELPAYACLNQHLIIVYTLHNQTESQTLDAECALDENEFFGISGKKQELIQVLPGESAEYKYVVCPLQVGHCRLPHFRLKLNNYATTAESSSSNNNFESALQNMLPSQLFVFPEKPSAQVETSFFKIQAQ